LISDEHLADDFKTSWHSSNEMAWQGGLSPGLGPSPHSRNRSKVRAKYGAGAYGMHQPPYHWRTGDRVITHHL